MLVVVEFLRDQVSFQLVLILMIYCLHIYTFLDNISRN